MEVGLEVGLELGVEAGAGADVEADDSRTAGLGKAGAFFTAELAELRGSDFTTGL